MTSRWGDLSTEAHAYTGPGLPVLRGTRLPVGTHSYEDVPVEDRTIPVHLDPSHGVRKEHDYAYGLSRASLRPTGPFPLDGYGQAKRIERAPNPSARKRRKRPPEARPEPERIVARYVIAEPVLRDVPTRRRIRHVVAPVSRNPMSDTRLLGDDLSDLLEDSQ